MIPIREFLNKIKWNKSVDQSDYKIIYFDNKLKRNIEIPFSEIKKIEKNFMVIERDFKEVDIPFHTITEVRKKEKEQQKLVWSRKYGK